MLLRILLHFELNTFIILDSSAPFFSPAVRMAPSLDAAAMTLAELVLSAAECLLGLRVWSIKNRPCYRTVLLSKTCFRSTAATVALEACFSQGSWPTKPVDRSCSGGLWKQTSMGSFESICCPGCLHGRPWAQGSGPTTDALGTGSWLQGSAPTKPTFAHLELFSGQHHVRRSLHWAARFLILGAMFQTCRPGACTRPIVCSSC